MGIMRIGYIFAEDRERRSRLTGLGPAAPAALRLGKLIHGVGASGDGDGAAANSDDGRRLQFAAAAAGQTRKEGER